MMGYLQMSAHLPNFAQLYDCIPWTDFLDLKSQSH